MYKIFIHVGKLTASDLYRCLLPYRHTAAELLRDGIHLTCSQNLSLTDEYDCYIFHRAINPHFWPFMLDLKIRQDKTIVWDMDDNLFRIPEWSPAGEMTQKGAKESLSLCLNLADHVTVTTQRFADQLAAMNPGWAEKTVVLPNLIDRDDWGNFSRMQSGRVRVMWAGSLTHSEDLALVVPAVDQIIEKYSDSVEFIFMGMMPESFKPTEGNIKKYKNIITFFPGVDLVYYPSAVRALAPDVALLPLSPCEFNDAKSPIKYFEMTMAGAVCVASPIGPYADTIPRACGLFARLQDDWYSTTMRAISSPSLAGDMAALARMHVLGDHSWQSPARDVWLNFFRSLAR